MRGVYNFPLANPSADGECRSGGCCFLPTGCLHGSLNYVNSVDATNNRFSPSHPKPHQHGEGLLQTLATVGPDPRPRPALPLISHSTWQSERVCRLLHILRGLDRRVLAGQSLIRSAARAARRWRGHHYKSRPGGTVQFSQKTLIRLFYLWRRNGRTAEALQLRYRPIVRRKVRPEDVVNLLQACASPEITSLRQAYRQLKTPMGSESAYRHNITPGQRRLLSDLFTARRQASRANRQAQALLAKVDSAYLRTRQDRESSLNCA